MEIDGERQYLVETLLARKGQGASGRTWSNGRDTTMPSARGSPRRSCRRGTWRCMRTAGQVSWLTQATTWPGPRPPRIGAQSTSKGSEAGGGDHQDRGGAASKRGEIVAISGRSGAAPGGH